MASKRTWCWRRRIAAERQDDWIARLEAAGCATWTATGKPGSSRLLLAVYSATKTEVAALGKLFGGEVKSIPQKQWLPTKPTPPTRIARNLEIIHEKARGAKKSAMPHLHVPHGLAFGSGEHGTTGMLLRALAGRCDWSGKTVLDLGTGSGVLGLAARLFGAKKIVATDFDAEAVRTARQNEDLNFKEPAIRWLRSDVKRLGASTRYDLVLANLFSGILIEAANRIAAVVAPGGELWLSGILKSQEREVTAAYCARKLKLLRSVYRGKWTMLQWTRS